MCGQRSPMKCCLTFLYCVKFFRINVNKFVFLQGFTLYCKKHLERQANQHCVCTPTYWVRISISTFKPICRANRFKRVSFRYSQGLIRRVGRCTAFSVRTQLPSCILLNSNISPMDMRALEKKRHVCQIRSDKLNNRNSKNLNEMFLLFVPFKSISLRIN